MKINRNRIINTETNGKINHFISRREVSFYEIGKHINVRVDVLFDYILLMVLFIQEGVTDNSFFQIAP
ncbi:hypothetical protein M3572_02460 [Lederbergia lenta]|nr:hypothetical protein [Lederbergia lenta]